MTPIHIYNFVKESNAIENIFREPTDTEIEEFQRFINLSKITINELKKFVSVYQPNAKLRSEYGMNVRVGKYYPPFGGPTIVDELQQLLDKEPMLDAFSLHIEYEIIHPFMDVNGRSGRALWAWKYKDLARGFLFPFYMSSLAYFSRKK